jgi:hypothetical protein
MELRKPCQALIDSKKHFMPKAVSKGKPCNVVSNERPPRKGKATLFVYGFHSQCTYGIICLLESKRKTLRLANHIEPFDSSAVAGSFGLLRSK